jgi:hypothetical protein
MLDEMIQNGTTIKRPPNNNSQLNNPDSSVFDAIMANVIKATRDISVALNATLSTSWPCVLRFLVRTITMLPTSIKMSNTIIIIPEESLSERCCQLAISTLKIASSTMAVIIVHFLMILFSIVGDIYVRVWPTIDVFTTYHCHAYCAQ